MGHVSVAASRADAGAPRWLVVTGMAFEARLLSWPGATTLSGLRGDALDAAMIAALHDDAGSAPRYAGLISFGVAGGLDPALPPGSVILADAVAAEGSRFDTDARWTSVLRMALPAAVGGTIAGTDTPAAAVADKRALHAATGAVAVDMESHRIAAAARAAGLPFVVCRAIADPAGRRVPPAALAAFGADGGIAMRALSASLLKQPAQLGELLRLAGDAAAARRGLRRLAAALRCSAYRSSDHGAAGAGTGGEPGASIDGEAPPAAPSPSSPSSP
ncbi:squalene-hopene cyclase [Cupriavidus gilardii CR3]|uniref:Squalene--hopene cyclase n=1 Tax=Cupriavidus gilardii TaxID=82541 RepID=A0A849BE01_9BURK|nr:squalene-hopene cyclase [Cupriavidus gilardii CR3]KAB0593118.1 squalene--hopene cyclase [Cupriavidus gilardii]NNH14151.1 squalene--hopene cyclase [Cupriavidus gilardii]QQE09751.1 squalene--hopene cyclase [Cupriavidus sp. ISTL7]